MPTPVKTQLPPNSARSLSLTGSGTIQIEAGGEGTVSALPRFQMVAYTGTPMRVSGWRHPVVIDLAGLAIPSQSRPIRFGHDALAGVGHTDAIRVEQGQLLAAGLVSRDTPAAREVIASSRNGFPWQASVGASVEEFEFIRENQQVTVNGRQHQGPLNVIRRSTLGEISFVDLGADGATSASVAATLSDDDTTDLDSVDAGGDPQIVSQTGAPASAAGAVALNLANAPVAGNDTIVRIRLQAEIGRAHV